MILLHVMETLRNLVHAAISQFNKRQICTAVDDQYWGHFNYLL